VPEGSGSCGFQATPTSSRHSVNNPGRCSRAGSQIAARFREIGGEAVRHASSSGLGNSSMSAARAGALSTNSVAAARHAAMSARASSSRPAAVAAGQ